MRFLIVTHAEHIEVNNNYFSYAPYVNEMNLWINHVDEVYIIAPKIKRDISSIETYYKHPKIHFIPIDTLHFKSFKTFFSSIWSSLKIMLILISTYKKVDHIHLRCPGNIGLLGAIIQIFFPKKKKTVKYAGNWDLAAKQPISYNLQKWILRNTFLSKNIKVLVYGDWKKSTKNIVSFFTATYSENEKIDIKPRTLNNAIKFIFVGTLSVGKSPIYAIEIVKSLRNNGHQVTLEIFGNGVLKNEIEDKIATEELAEFVFLKGNTDKEKMKLEYQNAHFLILPSKSEGWPKVVAEAMFWKCLPISTNVSCVPYMLQDGNRGILLKNILLNDVNSIKNLIQNEKLYFEKCNLAYQWSSNFTIEKFEKEIKEII